MDIFILLLNIISVVFNVFFAFVIYQLIRLLVSFFRASSTDKARERFMILRMNDRTIGILCAICFMALVL